MAGRFSFRVLLAVLVVALAAGAGFWAGLQFAHEADGGEVEVLQPVTATARSGTLGEEYAVPVSLEWVPDLALPFLGEAGVVTALSAESGSFASVASGSVIGAVDGEPIVVIEGDHPAYRPMAPGVAGEDVEQLQNHLVSAGFLAVADADGSFGVSTARAVQSWWATLGVSGRDTVPLGRVIFAGDLPRLLSTDSSVRVGHLIATGAPLLAGVSSTPVTTVELTEIQESRFLAEGATFTVNDPTGAVVELTVLESRVGDRAVEVQLAFPPGGFDEWPQLTRSPGQPARISGRMVVTPPTEGTLVPLAALNDHAGADATLRLADGATVDVRVVAVVGGQAIVDPLEPGTDVVVGQ